MSPGLAPGRRKRHLSLACRWNNRYLAYRPPLDGIRSEALPRARRDLLVLRR